MNRIFRISPPRRSAFLVVFLAVFLLLAACATLNSVPDQKPPYGYRRQNESMLCPPSPTPTDTPTPTNPPTPTIVPTPEFGSFEPSSWATTHNPICSIKARDLGSGLDTTSAHYRWSSNSLEDLQQQPWLSATISGDYGTTEWQTISVTVPFTRDSSRRNLVQFAITNTAGYSATSVPHTVMIDTIPPGPWLNFTRLPDLDVEVTAGQLVTYMIEISDATSGLDCDRASYQYRTEHGWSEWISAASTCAGTVGITTPQVISTRGIRYLPRSTSLPCGNENKVWFQIADAAGHFSSALRQEEYCTYLPAVMRCYPRICCDVPLNGDFAISENDFAADWDRWFLLPPSEDRLVVNHESERILMGWREEDTVIAEVQLDLPEGGGCAFARLQQDFYLPSGCFGDLWLQFEYQLFSYDCDREAGDAFLVFMKDLEDKTIHPIYDFDFNRISHSCGERDAAPDTPDVQGSPNIPLPTSLGGGWVRLWFEVKQCEEWPRSKAWWPTWVYLDNVSITNEP